MRNGTGARVGAALALAGCAAAAWGQDQRAEWRIDVPRLAFGAAAGEFDPSVEVGPVPPLVPPPTGAGDALTCWTTNGAACWEGKRVGVGISAVNYPLHVASGASQYAGVFQSVGLNSRGVYGASLSTTGVAYGGVFQSMSAQGVGVYALANASSGINFGVYGVTNSPAGYAGYFVGRGYFSAGLGVGTPTPSALLDVRGGAKFGDPGAAASEVSVAAASGAWKIGSDAGGNGTGGNQFFLTEGGSLAGAYTLTAQTGTGRVGIGTAAPLAKLHVSDAGTAAAVRISGDDPILVLENTGAGGHNYSVYAKDGDFQLRDAGAGIARLLITSDGKMGVGTATPNFDFQVVGTLAATTKNFVIDHPLDPGKELVHACVESDEYKNVYDGVVTTDGAGYATVTLPAWFGALNEKFRYQLTVVDEDAPDTCFVRVSRRIEGADGEGPCAFVIRTVPGNLEVCWQVTGVRKDPYVRAHPLRVERAKAGPRASADPGGPR